MFLPLYRAFIFIFPVLILALTGCSTNAQRTNQRLQDINAQGRQAWLQCMQRITDDPRFSPVTRRLSPNTMTPSLEFLSDTGKPNAAERALIVEIHRESQPCRQIAFNTISQISSEMLAAIRNRYSQSDQILLDLVQGNATWGQANQRNVSAHQTYLRENARAEQNLRNRLQGQHSAELAQRQVAMNRLEAAGYAMQQQALQQQMINAVNRPVTTNCVRAGNTVNCQTF